MSPPAPTAIEFLRKLRFLKYAYWKLSRAVPNRTEAKKEAQRRYDDVILALQDPVLRKNLDDLMRTTGADVRRSPNAIVNLVKGRREDILREEAKDASAFGIKRNELQKIFDNFLRNADDLPSMLDSANSFEELLKDLHRTNLSTYDDAVDLPRKEKKSRKRDFARGTFNILTGSAIIIANTKTVLAFPISYALGGGSVLEGMRDYLGKISE